jgi:hypothetical protein
MKNNDPSKNAPKAAPSKSNVCGADIAATGKSAEKATKACEEKINTAVDELSTPVAESA